MKALPLNVYRHNYNDSWNPDYDPTNGGISGRYDKILVPCDDGWVNVDPTACENLFRIEGMHIGQCFVLHLVPYDPRREGMVGPMFGGNYATTSDSRWGRWLAEHFGNEFRFNTCLAIHDRYETPEVYEALSR